MEPTLDWCEVTGTATSPVDPATIERFRVEVCPSRAVLAMLTPAPDPTPTRAPAWPVTHDNPTALSQLLGRGTTRVADAHLHWVTRLQLRRLLFAAVMIAPPSHGGLGLGRDRALSLTPAQLSTLRNQIGTAQDPQHCPACAVSMWLEVLGTNNGWSHASVRALGQRCDDPSASHPHQKPDPSTDWPNCVGLLPAIDRWGYLDLYGSIHRSSLSVLVTEMADLLAAPLRSTAASLPDPEPRPVTRHIPIAEQDAIFARADELTARVDALLAGFKNDPR